VTAESAGLPGDRGAAIQPDRGSRDRLGWKTWDAAAGDHRPGRMALDAVDITALRTPIPGMLSADSRSVWRWRRRSRCALTFCCLTSRQADGPDGRRRGTDRARQLKQSYPVTAIMAENDADIVAEFADRIIVCTVEPWRAKDRRGRVPRHRLAGRDWRSGPASGALAAQLRTRWPHLDFVTVADAQKQLARCVGQVDKR